MSSTSETIYWLKNGKKTYISKMSNLMLSIINYNKDPSQFDTWINDPNEINKLIENTNISALYIAIIEMDNHKSVDLIKRLLEAGEEPCHYDIAIAPSIHTISFVHLIKDNNLMKKVIELLSEYDKKFNCKFHGYHLLTSVTKGENPDIDKIKTIVEMKFYDGKDLKYAIVNALSNINYEIAELLINISNGHVYHYCDHDHDMIKFLSWQNKRLSKKIEALEQNQNLRRYIQDKIPPIEAMIVDYAKQ
jgi:hypothetical protein